MLKVGLCGAHGTGKTTLLEIIAKEYSLTPVKRTMRDMWERFGISDFEKMPTDVRTMFQKYSVLNQIQQEDKTNSDFITDRTVVDNLGYSYLSSNMSGADLQMFEQLVKERFRNYTHFIYFPVEFAAENEYLRANIDSRERLDGIFRDFLEKNFKNSYLSVTGSVEERMKQVKEYLNN